MSQIRFFNSLGRELQLFEPLQEGKVRLYTCGPTVYNTAHIGNLRTFLFEDILCRTLEYFDFQVEQVMNLTDVEDKIIAGALESGVSIEEFVEPHVETFFQDLARLHIREAERYPRATQHIPEMIALIESLMERGFAYEADGCIFFRIASDDDYGRLSGVDLTQLKQGERVADDEYDKENARDFVLWKEAKEGEPSWPSPWGNGRPGWHIECSAMSMKYLGTTFDIHCGGVDNAFPHHENEIAQSESATGELFSRYWLHSEFLLVEGRKMSKSLGNQYTLQDLVDKGLDLRAVRYEFLSTHYRDKLNFTFRGVQAAATALGRIDELRFRLRSSPENERGQPEIADSVEALETGFGTALADDLNLSAALGAVHSFTRQVNIAIEKGSIGAGDKERVGDALRRVDGVLGVLHQEDWATEEPRDAGGLADSEIEDLIRQRTEARARADYSEADRIRDRLQEEGVVIEDLRDGARWKRL